MPYVTANGIRLHYERTGGFSARAKKPPIILLHGITDSGACWPRLQAALAPDYDLIMPDARLHGLSDAPPASSSAHHLPDNDTPNNDMPNDVAGLIDALGLCKPGLTKPGLIGHSMGAVVAAGTAALYPQSVGYVVLEDPPWRWPERTDEEHAASIEKFRQRILLRRSMTTEQMIDYGLRENPGMALWDKSEFAGWSEAKRRVHENAEEHLGVHLFRFSQIAPRITCPALLLRADPGKGGSVTEEVARRVCALNPRIEVVHIAQAGHNIRREAFEQYLAAVSAFLSRVAV